MSSMESLLDKKREKALSNNGRVSRLVSPLGLEPRTP